MPRTIVLRPSLSILLDLPSFPENLFLGRPLPTLSLPNFLLWYNSPPTAPGFPVGDLPVQPLFLFRLVFSLVLDGISCPGPCSAVACCGFCGMILSGSSSNPGAIALESPGKFGRSPPTLGLPLTQPTNNKNKPQTAIIICEKFKLPLIISEKIFRGSEAIRSVLYEYNFPDLRPFKTIHTHVRGGV